MATVVVGVLACVGSSATGARQVYWGAYVGGGQYGQHDAPWDMSSVTRFENAVGKRMSLLEWGQDWYECSTSCGMRGFRADLMSRARSRGYLPVLSWGSYAAQQGTDQPDFKLSEILSGRYDDFVKRWARGAKAWGHPFFLRFDWEMNTNGVSYSEHSNGNQRGEFVRMWRHVHEIFEEVGAKNAQWVWCPNVEYRTSVKPLSSLYPGNAYVDWTCLDGYNWGTNPASACRMDVVRPGLPPDLRPPHQAHRPVETADDRRDRVDGGRRLQGLVDHGRATARRSPRASRASRRSSGSTSSGTTWTGRSRRRPARRTRSVRRSHRRST